MKHVTEFVGRFRDQENEYLAMEHCGGGDLLERLLAEGRAMKENRVGATIARPLLIVLKAMHEHYIIHR